MAKNERILVGFTVLNTILSVFTYFNIAYNGIGEKLFAGKIGIVAFILYILVLLVYGTPKCYNQSYKKYSILLSFTFLFIWFLTWDSSGQIENFYIIAIVYVGSFVMFRDDLKIKCFEWFIRVFALILAVALIEYVIYSVTGLGVVLYSSIYRPGDNTVVLSQLMFNLLTDTDTSFLFRFQCLSEEPGVIGTVCGFLIFLVRDNKKYKREYIIFLIAGFLSFTLAFYAMFLIHIVNLNSLKIRNIILIFATIVLGIIYFGDLIDEFLLYRIVGKDIVDIDNRSGSDFAVQFNKALKNGSLWLSNYNKGYNINGAGLKMFIWRYGILSLIVLFLSYTYVYYDEAKRHKSLSWGSLLFFIAYWISFYQRHYVTNMEYVVCFFIAPLIFVRMKQKI